MKTVERALNSVGKTVFIENYEMFKYWEDKAKIAENLKNNGIGGSDNARRTRASNARWIFENGYEKEALMIIINAKRLPDNIRSIAEFEYNRLVNPPRRDRNIPTITPEELGEIIMRDLGK